MSILFESISQDEKLAITNYIKQYAPRRRYKDYSINLEHILHPWVIEKENLFNLLGNNLIISKPVTVEESTEELWVKMLKMLNGNQFYPRILDIIINDANIESSFPTAKDLITNKYSGKDFEITAPNGQKIKVNKGCKMSKILGKIAKIYNLNGYEEFRIIHSQCLNQKTLSGELCLSIHPLDYMTMSDNNCDWSSCMSWREEGEYRQGTVEMMNSPYIIVAYLKTKNDDFDIPPINWNSKKWRQLIVVSKDLLLGIRSYPYANSKLEYMVLDWIRELCNNNPNFNNFLIKPYRLNNCKEQKISDSESLYLNLSMNHMYNDISRNHLAFLSENHPDNISIMLSGMSECMICGWEYHGIESSLVCADCEEMHTCENCNEFYFDEDLIDFQGHLLCADCFNEYVCQCDVCKEEFYNDYTIDSIIFYLSNGNYRNKTEVYICPECLKTIGKASMKIEYFGLFNSRVYCIDIKNLSQKGEKMFKKILNVQEFTEDLFTQEIYPKERCFKIHD